MKHVMNLKKKQQITFKYHKHLEDGEMKEGVYFTMEDVWKIIDEAIDYEIQARYTNQV